MTNTNLEKWPSHNKRKWHWCGKKNNNFLNPQWQWTWLFLFHQHVLIFFFNFTIAGLWRGRSASLYNWQECYWTNHPVFCLFQQQSSHQELSAHSKSPKYLFENDVQDFHRKFFSFNFHLLLLNYYLLFKMLAVLCAVTFMGDARPSNGGYGYPPRTVSLPVLPPGSFGPLAPMGARSSALLDDSSELDDLEDMDPLEMALNPLGTLDKVLGGGGGGGGGYKKTLILG